MCDTLTSVRALRLCAPVPLWFETLCVSLCLCGVLIRGCDRNAEDSSSMRTAHAAVVAAALPPSPERAVSTRAYLQRRRRVQSCDASGQTWRPFMEMAVTHEGSSR